MKKAILITAALLIFSCMYKIKAQSNLDSLWNVWSDEDLPDTTRAEALRTYAWEGYLFSAPDSAYFFAQLEYDFAKEKGLKSKMADALNIQGISYAYKGDYETALEYFHSCLALFIENHDKKGMAHAYNSIGNSYRQTGNSLKALKYFKESLKYSQEINDAYSTGRVLGNIGAIYSSQDEYEKANTYYEKGHVIYEKLNDHKSLVQLYMNMGTNCHKQKDYDQALQYFAQAFTYSEGDPLWETMLKGNMAISYIEKGEFDEANRLLDECMIEMAAIEFSQGIAVVKLAKGDIYKKQKQFEKAIKWCNESFEESKKDGILGQQKDACECLYNSYKALGNTPKVLEFYEKFILLSDSLKKGETAKELQQMEFEKIALADSLTQVAEKIELERLHAEEVRKKDRNRNIFIASGLFFLILAGGFYSRWNYIKRSKASLQTEKDRSDNLLLNILPAEIAEELKATGKAKAQDFEKISIIFTDFKGFTQASAKLSAQDLVAEINTCFEAFDHIMGKYSIEKIKTIGDAYMAASGLPVPNEKSVKNAVLAALEMQVYISKRKAENDALEKPAFEMRVGIHTGPIVAGIVGVKKFQYDIWGDTVNTASRMESSGQVGKVNISEATYQFLKEESQFSFESRGKIEAKGKGAIEMYFVSKMQ